MGFLVAGLDIGSVGVKAVLYDGENIVAHNISPTGWNPKESGTVALETLLVSKGLGKENLAGIVTTGYGRNSLTDITGSVTEITCHAAGAAFLFPEARTVLDIGGQDSKVLATEPGGGVRDFLMNDKCAAGTGRFLQTMAVLLEYDMDDFSHVPDDIEPYPISSMCTVFAETEVIGLLARGIDKNAIALGLLDSIATRAEGMLRKIGGAGPIVFTGGVSGSQNLVALLKKRMGRDILTSGMSQLAGAIGAALIAAKRHDRQDTVQTS